MLTSVRARMGALVLLLGALVGLLVWYGTLAPAPGVGDFPDQEDLASDYERYVGERVVVDGRVRGTDPVSIDARYGVDSRMRLTIVDLSIDVRRGEVLRVYGVVEPDRTIRSLDAFTVPRTGLWYAWSISFLAGVWVLARILGHWRLDRSAWALRPRNPEPGRRPLRSSEGGDRDA